MREQEIAKLFEAKQVRVTPQRIAVYKYLCENPTHPNANEIYDSVIKLHPSFSKTTVYNSLSALEECGLIVKINADNDCIRYDCFVENHGHFICSKCNKLYDFKLNSVDYSLPNDFEIIQKGVYFRGICPECK